MSLEVVEMLHLLGLAHAVVLLLLLLLLLLRMSVRGGRVVHFGHAVAGHVVIVEVDAGSVVVIVSCNTNVIVDLSTAYC